MQAGYRENLRSHELELSFDCVAKKEIWDEVEWMNKMLYLKRIFFQF